MPLLQAWESVQPNGRLEVVLCNTSGPNADASSVVYSLRSSHPSYFALIGSELPDGVLLPGERRTLLLELRPESLKWWYGAADGGGSSNSSREQHTLTSTGTAVVEASPWGLISSQSQLSLTNSASRSILELQWSRASLPSTSPIRRQPESLENENSHSSSFLHNNGVGNEKEGKGLETLTGTKLQEPRRVEHSSGFVMLRPPAQRRREGGAVLGSARSENNRSSGIKFLSPVNCTRQLLSDSSPSENTPMERTKHGVLASRDVSLPSVTRPRGFPARRRYNTETPTKTGTDQVKNSNDRNKSILHESIDSSMAIQKSDNMLPAWRTTDPSYDVVDRKVVSVSDSESAKENGNLSSVSQAKPYFFVYYERLGDESGCLDAANKWLKNERVKYLTWQEKLRQRMQKEAVEECSCVPSVLGEPVRWLNNVRGVSAVSRSSGFNRKAYSRSSTKMFKSSRQGGGCILLPCQPSGATTLAALATVAASFSSSLNVPRGNVVEMVSSESEKMHQLEDAGHRAGQGLALFDLSENIHKSNSNSTRHYTTTSDNSIGGDTVGTRRPSAADDNSLFHRTKSSDPVSISRVSNDYAVPVSSPYEQGLVVPRRVLVESQTFTQSLPQFSTTTDPQVHHRRTETEGTVQMLEQTVRGEGENADCVNQRRGRAKILSVRSGDSLTCSGNFQANPKSKSLERNGSTFSSSQQEEGNSTSTTPMDSGSPLGKKRASVRKMPGRGHSWMRKGSPSLGSRRGAYRAATPTAIVSDLSIAQLGEALRVLANRSAPLVQTAVGGTVTTVSTSAQLIGGLLQDSIDILVAVGIPLLVFLSMCLLYMVFAGIGDAEDEAATVTMGFFGY